MRDNWIYDNADRGIQLYPDADGSTITGNVIDSNGDGIVFGGDGPAVSSGNLVTGNVISNSNLGWNVYSNTPGAPAEGNVVRRTASGRGTLCPSSGPTAASSPPSSDFSTSSNTVVDPRYTDPDAHDFTLSPDERVPACPASGAPSAGRRRLARHFSGRTRGWVGTARPPHSPGPRARRRSSDPGPPRSCERTETAPACCSRSPSTSM